MNAADPTNLDAGDDADLRRIRRKYGSMDGPGLFDPPAVQAARGGCAPSDPTMHGTFRPDDVAHLIRLHLADRATEVCAQEVDALRRILGRYLTEHRVPAAELIDGREATGPHGDRVLGELGVDAIQAADLKHWLLWVATLPGRGYGPDGARNPVTVDTVNVFRAKALKVWAWAAEKERGYASEVTAARLALCKRLRAGRHTPARVTEPVDMVPEHIIRDACVWARAKASWSDRGDRRHSWLACAVAVELGRETGCRPGELAQLVFGELHEDRGMRLIRPGAWKTMGHGGPRREIPLSKRAGELIDELTAAWRDRRGERGLFEPADGSGDAGERLFPWKGKDPTMPFTRSFKKACVGAGHPAYTANQLRHTFISVGVLVNPEKTRIIAGHANLAPTEGYRRTTTLDAADLVEDISAASLLPPPAPGDLRSPEPPSRAAAGAWDAQRSPVSGQGSGALLAPDLCPPGTHGVPVPPAGPAAAPKTEADWLLIAASAADPAVAAAALDFAARLRPGGPPAGSPVPAAAGGGHRSEPPPAASPATPPSPPWVPRLAGVR